MYRWVEHTAELGLEIEADTAEGIFFHAVRAFAELLGDGDDFGPARQEISIGGTGIAPQLANFLQELVYLAETQDFVPDDLFRIELDDNYVRGTVLGHVGTPRHLVKAVTYHGLSFERSDGGWKASVVLDV